MATKTAPAQISVDQIPELVASTREVFNTGRTLSREWRMEQLNGLQRFLEERQDDILAALQSDFGKSHFETLVSEVLALEMDVADAKKNLLKWMRPEKVGTWFLHQPGKSKIVKSPLGVVLIISAWNYPMHLALCPLVGAIAAGNAAVVKPSEVSPAISALMAEALPKYLDNECIKFVEGGVPETTELLKQRFDHIFYTGNGTVARIIMKAAAENLTPVTLELGGKSPCLVDSTADLDVTARRIVWGRFFNCGQTCVAPDYVLVEERFHDQLVAKMVKCVEKMFGPDPQKSPNFARVVNERHFNRLMGLLDGGGKAVCGGRGDKDDCYIAPTILTDVPEDAQVMKDEIFGPILPIVSVPDMNAAIEFVRAREKPLAFYLFSNNVELQERIQKETFSGGLMINQVLLHYLTTDLPFGGVGESGMGAYHGKASFDTFTHRRSVMTKPFSFDVPLLYPPYSGKMTRWLAMGLRMWRRIRG